MNDTIFHKILRKEIPADVVYEDDDVFVFKDIHPKDTTHLLFIPKNPDESVESVAMIDESNKHLPGMLIEKARLFAKEKGIDGYKLQFNVGSGGGQEVFYLHLHFLSSQSF